MRARSRERSCPLPGDELLPRALASTTQAITIRRPRAKVWPWLAQMGAGRGAVASVHIVVTAGFAEVAAGSIAMGLGGYLAARSDAEHYVSELAREEREIVQVPDVEATEVIEILQSYGVEPTVVGGLLSVFISGEGFCCHTTAELIALLPPVPGLWC